MGIIGLLVALIRIIVLLDSKHRVLRTAVVTSGTLNTTIVQPRVDSPETSPPPDTPPPENETASSTAMRANSRLSMDGSQSWAGPLVEGAVVRPSTIAGCHYRSHRFVYR